MTGHIALDLSCRLSHLTESGGCQILLPGDHRYDEARQVYNRMHNRYPAAVVRSLLPNVLRTCIESAIQHSAPLTVKGGGHHIAGFAVADGGVTIDFSTHRSVTVNPVSGVLTAAPGARLADVDAALEAAGRMMPLGTVSDTGLAGLTLGGGIGWLVGRFGLTCDCLIGATVLLADGRLVEAEEEPELLWALRGGCGNFGIVIEFRFKTFPIQAVLFGSASARGAVGKRLLSAAILKVTEAPRRELTIAPVITANGGEPLVSVDFCITASTNDHCELLLRDFARALPICDWSVRRGEPFSTWQAAFDADFHPPMRGYWRSRYSSCIGVSDLDIVLSAISEDVPFCRRSILIEHLHGAYFDNTGDASFPLRAASFGILISSRWPSASDDSREIAWVRETSGDLNSFGSPSVGSYSNYSFPSVSGQCIFGPEIWRRLSRVKQIFDPHNRFRLNHNVIPPATPQPTEEDARHAG